MVKFVTTMEVLQLAVICSVLFSVHGAEVDVTGGEAVNVRPQEGADLSCTASGVNIKFCTFISPTGANFNVAKETVYDDRISFLGEDEAKDCGIKISNVNEADNGVWKCEITAIVDGSARKGSNQVKLNVLKAPSSVSLDDQGGSLTAVYKQDQEKKIRCTATGGQPAPTFSWTLDGEMANLQITGSDTESSGEVVTSFQEVSYVPKPEDNDKELVCIANSQAYTDEDMKNGVNQAATKLNIEYAPTAQKEEYDFYGLEVGQPSMIRIVFSMNPAPSNLNWMMADGTEVPQNVEYEKYSSSNAEYNEDTKQYTAVLTILKVETEMFSEKKINTLTVENEHGEVKINFKLAAGEKPPVDSGMKTEDTDQKTDGEAGTGPVIAVVIIILVIIVVVAVFVVARSQGLLCFAVPKQSAEDDDKEKAVEKEEGSDTESADATEAVDGKPEATEDNKPLPKKSVSARVTSLLSAMKKTVASKKSGGSGGAESEELKEGEERKEGETEDNKDDIVYADLDKSAMSDGGATVTVENEKTEYAEIQK